MVFIYSVVWFRSSEPVSFVWGRGGAKGSLGLIVLLFICQNIDIDYVETRFVKWKSICARRNYFSKKCLVLFVVKARLNMISFVSSIAHANDVC